MKKILLIALMAFSFMVMADDQDIQRNIEFAQKFESPNERFLFIQGEIDNIAKMIGENRGAIDAVVIDRNKNVDIISKRFTDYDKKFAIMAAKVAALQAKIVEIESNTGAQTKW